MRLQIKDPVLREFALGNVRQAVNVGQILGTAITLGFPKMRVPTSTVLPPFVEKYFQTTK